MAKKKKNKQSVVRETPRQAIVRRGRNLELYKCWVNHDWAIHKLANIIVARKHTNGNITLAVFLVDLYLKGVKDIVYRFNIPLIDYEALIKRFYKETNKVEVDYEIAHNIIYGALEFADDAGYKPAPDFEVAKNLLQPDDDQIELIDIAFGYKGKFCLLENYDADFEKDKAHLEQRFSPDEYIILHPDAFPLFYDPENDYLLEPENNINEYSKKLKEKKIKVEDIFEIVEDGFRIELKLSEDLRTKNQIKYYPQDILNHPFDEEEDTEEELGDDQELYFDLLKKTSELKPRKLLKQKDEYLAFFRKHNEHPMKYLLQLYYYHAVDDNQQKETAIKALLENTTLKLAYRNELAAYFYNNHLYDKIILAYNHSVTMSDFGTVKISAFNSSLYFFYLGIYFLSKENVRQTEQYYYLLAKFNNPYVKYNQILKLKMTSVMAKALGDEVFNSLPRELKEEL